MEAIKDYEPKTKSKAPVIIAIIVVILAILGGVLYGFLSGAFLDPKEKILLAAAKTFTEERHTLDALKKATTVLLEDETSTEGTVDVFGLKAEARFDKTEDERQLSGTLYLENMMLPNIEGTLTLDKETLYAKVPLISQTDVFAYYYREKLDGIIGQYYPTQAEIVGKLLREYYDFKFEEDDLKEYVTNFILPTYDRLTVKKGDYKRVEIGGKEENARGYNVYITKEDVYFLWDKINGSADYKKYTESLAKISNLTAKLSGIPLEFTKEDVDGTIQSRIDKIAENIEDTTCAVYIFDGKLADIFIESQGNTIEILFKGNQNRTDSIEITENDKSLLALNIETSGNTEITSVEAFGETAELKYDFDSGDYALSGFGKELNGKFLPDEDGLNFSFKYGTDITGDFTVSEGAQILVPEGKEVDITDLTEEDLMKYYYGLFR